MNIVNIKNYTYDEFIKYVEVQNNGNKYEWDDGLICMSPPPSTTHYKLSEFIKDKFKLYLKDKPCRVFSELYVHFLNDNGDGYKVTYIPDIMIVCHKKQLTNKGIIGSPDLVVEIVSPSSISRDYLEKLGNYMKNDVREYWIVNPMKQNIIIYNFIEKNISDLTIYKFTDTVNSNIFDGLHIDFGKFVDWEYEEWGE